MGRDNRSERPSSTATWALLPHNSKNPEYGTRKTQPEVKGDPPGHMQVMACARKPKERQQQSETLPVNGTVYRAGGNNDQRQ